ncbi:hypothetical protein [Ammoniphilus resinae]|uniref:Uncharacterized protein n=1 Tax=Ammoniphilus resinae TaxID=861532 RepID=A0ABS4GUH6_9BACL|nr:hypothetical protein [Ammoniphilus resinae]MBP1933914.1 hypothetical protein [Ammoniphilus resinae]
MKLTRIFLITLILSNATFMILRFFMDKPLYPIVLGGSLATIICLVLLIFREKGLSHNRPIRAENYFGLGIVSFFVGYTSLAIALVVELIKKWTMA